MEGDVRPKGRKDETVTLALKFLSEKESGLYLVQNSFSSRHHGQRKLPHLLGGEGEERKNTPFESSAGEKEVVARRKRGGFF